MDWKKLAYRAVRGTIYTGIAAFLSGKVATLLSLTPEVVTALATGILLAIDKALGIGGLVAPATKS